jgi:flagellar basal-body rod protein FlgB
VAINMSTVDTLERALTFHRDRQAVLAGNVANLDTPGYRPVDLVRSASTEGGLPQTVQSFDDGGALPSPDGNAVSLERELSKIDANRTRYSTVAELTGRRLAMLRYAAGDGT